MSAAPPNRWLRHATAAAARMVLATLAGLLLWAVLPTALGWQPSVVMSGSMEPAIRVGDVVLTREVPVDQLQPGHVLLVDDPARPGHRVMHRYDHQDDDGGLVLRGDANPQHDSTPVTGEDVLGVGVLRVPWVGLLYVWLAEGRHLPVGLTVLALLVLAALSPIRDRYADATPSSDSESGPGTADDGDSDGPEDVDGDKGTSSADGVPVPPRQPVASGAYAVGVLAIALLAVGGSAVAITTPVTAGFTDTVTMAATFTTGTWADTGEEELTTEGESDPSVHAEPEPAEPEPGDVTTETEPSEPEPGTEVSDPTPASG